MFMNDRILIFFLGLISLFNYSNAQEIYTGAVMDNYLGMTSTKVQPADIVDNRYKGFIGFATNTIGSNNFNALNFNNLIGFTKHPRNEYRDHFGRGYTSFYTHVDLFNGMFEYKHKNAFGYRLSLKSYQQRWGLPNELTFADFNDFANHPNTGVPFSYKNLSIQTLPYFEHSFHYGRVIQEDDDHYFKAGGAIKLINGLDASYFFSKSGTMTFVNSDGPQIAFTNTGGANQFGQFQPNTPSSDQPLGLGLDLGVVYEYRPERAKFRYNMDGERNLKRYDVNKYLYKIGVSLTDLGWVKFQKDSTTYDFDANGVLISGSTFLNLNNTGYDNLKNSLAQPETSESADNKEQFRMSLPAAINLQFDYNVYKNFYAAYTSNIPLGIPSNPNRVRHIAVHSVIPRYETKKWGVAIPLSIKGNGQFMLGGTVRKSVGALTAFVGSQNLTFLFGKRKIYDSHIFAGISIAIPHSIPSDFDKDEVSDLQDRCPYDPGSWEHRGCPDSDNDGIIDLLDHCIYDQGKKENHGCPDRDGDGIIDVNDHCPDEAGLAVHYGCPDRDRDGVIDAADACPDVPGIELNNGCPFENPGCCMDNDGDGVTNEEDQCPNVAGSVYNNGCPIDSTNINTINLNETKPEIDPNHTGEQIKDNPLEPKEDNGGFDPIEIDHSTNVNDLLGGDELKRLTINFKSDQSYIEEQYFGKIDYLLRSTNALKDDNITFVIIGHTDSDGSDEYNMILSRKRSETVRKHVQNKGIDFDRIKTYYYGESEPLNSENNEDFKRLNRRVEIIVVRKK